MTSQATPQTLLEEVSADLEHPARKLAFIDRIEARFLSSREEARVRHYIRICLIGLIAYNCFLGSDAFIMRDIFLFSLLFHTAVTVVSSVVLYLVYRRALPANAIVVNLLLILVNTLVNLSRSHSPDAHFLLFIVPVIFLFGNVILPFPFRVAVQFSAFCVLVTVLTIVVHPHLSLNAKILLCVVEMNLAGFTLIATYRSETFERRSFLLTLRETLRGEALAEQNRELAELSATDQLTGVANRRVFDHTFQKLWEENLRTRTPIALLIIDIDHFKRFNDSFGHLSGDLCLKKVAGRLDSLMHAHQSLARYGGEEFAVLLEAEGALKAANVAESLRAAIEAMPIALSRSSNQPQHITISIGCATIVPGPGLSSAELFLEADKALYDAKCLGRNRVQMHVTETDASLCVTITSDREPATVNLLSRN